MKKSTHLLYAILAASIYTSSAHASCTDGTGCLHVPGDFSNPVNNFSMYLLGGWFNIEYNDGYGHWLGIAGNGDTNGGITPINTLGNQLDFTATPFNQVGPGQGTSTLNANLNHVVLGSSADYFGFPATIYADGQATGSLVDNANSTQGHWTLNTHLFADWNVNYGIDLGLMPLSTNATYSYNVAGVCDIEGYNCTAAHDAVAAGTIMDYHSGLAYLVGQGIMQDGPFIGLRVTVGIQGQDPLVAPATVPVPAAAWLLGSGLLGLAGFARKRKTA